MTKITCKRLLPTPNNQGCVDHEITYLKKFRWCDQKQQKSFQTKISKTTTSVVIIMEKEIQIEDLKVDTEDLEELEKEFESHL
jgi:hypothetical protein